MKLFLPVPVCVVLALALYASPASAATANFQGDCLVSHTCDFSAQHGSAVSSCSPASITSYSWDFGDGTSGTGAFVTHFFPSSFYTVTLTVQCNNGFSAGISRFVSWSFGGGGIIISGEGYN